MAWPAWLLHSQVGHTGYGADVQTPDKYLMWIKSLKAQMLQNFGDHFEHGEWSEERLQLWQTFQLMRGCATAQCLPTGARTRLHPLWCNNTSQV